MNYDAIKLDQADSLAHHRDFFYLRENEIYLCGHSLGAMPKVMPEEISKILHHQWGINKIKAWNENDWINLPTKLGDKLALLLGANADEVIVSDTISVNLFKLLIAAMKLQPNKHVILTEYENFPADLYIAQGIHKLFPQIKVVMCSRNEILQHITDDTAVVMLTHANYRTSELHDMQKITQHAHAHGALVLFDLAHSIGVLPLKLNECEVDMAVGCTYKYLHGGPGAPAFIYVAKKHHANITTPLTGWMGHKSMFEFKEQYDAADGVSQFLCGTAPIISMQALAISLDFFTKISLDEIYKKSQCLTEYFIQQMDRYACSSFKLISPRIKQNRGGHVAYSHPAAYQIKMALQHQGIICDFRAPDTLRFGFSPLHTRFIDVAQTAEVISMVFKEYSYKKFNAHTKEKVT